MKIHRFILIGILAAIPFAYSCTDDSADLTPDNVNNTLQQSGWTVSLFTEDDNDETYHFTGYVFSFADNGVVSAVKQSTTVSGTYSSGTDDSTTKMILNFGNQVPFDELNEDWEVISKSDTKINLRHVSGGDGSIDVLEFTKN
ncbi:MAG TPA: hypothetical protein PLZ52_02775 [Bacteroidales bacterium]|nr:hypothetical protein [Bacteroidales bacterium]HOE04115.1 hypothetical protein [Bacteroidales bacterium]HQL69609.1 hypothetical protein [Bacteroidales bacterium]